MPPLQGSMVVAHSDPGPRALGYIMSPLWG